MPLYPPLVSLSLGFNRKGNNLKEKTAFVAMRFEGNHWNAKRYAAISDILEEAGYNPLRADQIKTSKPIVEEVCHLLENAELVIIDSTGDSHSVSYEIGYCHGVDRSQQKTILIRQGYGRDIPFNYRHFRHHCYKDLRHLKRLLRDWFSISLPLTNGQLGYVFNVIVGPDTGEYGYSVAKAFVSILNRKKFNGRCEYYAADGITFGLVDRYLVGVGLKNTKNAVPSLNWWLDFKKKLSIELKTVDGLELDVHCSELGELGSFRENFLLRGAVQFVKGDPSIILNQDSPESDSFFTSYINEKTQQGA